MEYEHDGGEYHADYAAEQDEHYDAWDAAAAYDNLPEDSWIRDPEWVSLAAGLIEAIQHDPAALEDWYSQYAKEAGLRELVAGAMDTSEITAKAGTPEHAEQVTAALKRAHGK